jgi:Holliday junction resolvase RusA-like endonuclease
MDALAEVTILPEYVHAVIYGEAPPSPRARATIVPVAPLTKLLARARHATKMSHLASLFRAQLYMGRASRCEVWKRDVERCLSSSKSESGWLEGETVFEAGQALDVLIMVVAPLPKGDHRKRTPPLRKWLTSLRSGDWDNVGKPICDAATGILWRDDVLIARGSVEKVRAAQGESPRLEILARALQDSPDETRLEQQVELERYRLQLAHHQETLTP